MFEFNDLHFKNYFLLCFLQIYDLAVDALSPQYYFLLPSGKIRDATFLFGDEGRFMVLMASSGYIYTQVMEESSSAQHGPFYITNVLEVRHSDLKVSASLSLGVRCRLCHPCV